MKRTREPSLNVHSVCSAALDRNPASPSRSARSHEHEHPPPVDLEESLRIEVQSLPGPVRSDPTDPLQSSHHVAIGIGLREIEDRVRCRELLQPGQEVGVELERPAVDPTDDLEVLLRHRHPVCRALSDELSAARLRRDTPKGPTRDLESGGANRTGQAFVVRINMGQRQARLRHPDVDRASQGGGLGRALADAVKND